MHQITWSKTQATAQKFRIKDNIWINKSPLQSLFNLPADFLPINCNRSSYNLQLFSNNMKKKRLTLHWGFGDAEAVGLCTLHMLTKCKLLYSSLLSFSLSSVYIPPTFISFIFSGYSSLFWAGISSNISPAAFQSSNFFFSGALSRSLCLFPSPSLICMWVLCQLSLISAHIPSGVSGKGLNSITLGWLHSFFV